MTESPFQLNESLAIYLLIGMSLLWIALGFIFGKKNKDFDDHAVAGRKVGFALGSATAVATWITSNTTMLAPQFALQLGIWGMIAYSTASLGLFLFAPLAGRIQDLMPNGYTSGDFIRLRYGKTNWALYMVITLFYSLTWLVSMAMAGGVLLETLSGVPYVVGMSAILFACVIYTMVGGLKAVIGTDFIQSMVILVGITVVGFIVLNNISAAEIFKSTEMESPKLVEVLFPAAIMALFNNLLFGLGEVFHNNVWWSRAFAMKKGVAKKSFIMGGIAWLPVPIAAGFIALACFKLGVFIPKADMVGPLIVSNLLGSTGAIAIFIIVFCSLASSIDSLLAAVSDLVTQDVYRNHINKNATGSQLRKTAMIITASLGIGTWLICVPRIGTLATVLFFAGPLVGSLIWPIITGLFWRKASSAGAFWAMLLGSGAGLWSYFNIGWYVAALVGAAVSMTVVLLFTWLKPDSFEWSQLNEEVSSS